MKAVASSIGKSVQKSINFHKDSSTALMTKTTKEYSWADGGPVVIYVGEWSGGSLYTYGSVQ